MPPPAGPSTGTAHVEFTLPATPGYAMCGLANGDTDQGYADIDFALYTYPGNGRLYIFEKGTYRGSFGAYASGDKLKVAVESGVVKYYRNGSPPVHLHSGSHLPAESRHLALLRRAPPSRRPRSRAPWWRLPESVAWVNAVGVSVASGQRHEDGCGRVGQRRRRVEPGHQRRWLPGIHRHRHAPATPCGPCERRHATRVWADIDFALYTYPESGRLLISRRGPIAARSEPTLRRHPQGGGRVRCGQVLPQRRPSLHLHSGPHPPAESRHVALLDGGRPPAA